MKISGNGTSWRTLRGGVACVGIAGSSAWLVSSGYPGLGITLAIMGGVVALLGAVVPQNSRDRVEWTRIILVDYLLARHRDHAVIQGEPVELDVSTVDHAQAAENAAQEAADAPAASTG